MKILKVLTMLIVTISLIQAENSAITFGVITDCQYKDVKGKGKRKYDQSLNKLEEAIENLNKEKPGFIIHLGDLIDSDLISFPPVLSILDKSKFPIYHVLGNHDFSVIDSEKSNVTKMMRMKSRYYDFKRKNWRFIVLDGNDLSLYAWGKESKEHKRSQEFYNNMSPKLPIWNGGVDQKQLKWLEAKLKASEKNKENVIIFCHFPVLLKDNHRLWNTKELVTTIEKYSCVKAYMNGHNHHGNYHSQKGIHYINFKGMVDTSKNSYALVKLSDKEIDITGFGREESKKLPLRD